MKTEPTTFSFEDLIKAPNRTTSWEGVRNYQARNLMRDSFKKGDLAFIYHSNTEDPAIMGIASVVKEAYTDSTALEKGHKYFDKEAAKKNISPWVMVDIKAKAKFKVPVTRSMMKENKSLSQMMVLKKGARLSVQPVTESEFKALIKMGSPIEL